MKHCPSGTLSIGQNTQFHAAAAYKGSGACSADGFFDVFNLATWSAVNPTVASVGAQGLVDPLSAGVATVNASFMTSTGGFSLTVVSKCINTLALAQAGNKYPSDVYVPLTVTATDSDGTVAAIGPSDPANGFGGSPPWNTAAVTGVLPTATPTEWVLDTGAFATGTLTDPAQRRRPVPWVDRNRQPITVDTTTNPSALTLSPPHRRRSAL